MIPIHILEKSDKHFPIKDDAISFKWQYWLSNKFLAMLRGCDTKYLSGCVAIANVNHGTCIVNDLLVIPVKSNERG